MNATRCDRCGGNGRLRSAEPECNGGRIMEPCERCHGTGLATTDEPIPAWAYDLNEAEVDDDDDEDGTECGRWENGRLMPQCRKAGSEECDWECPYGC